LLEESINSMQKLIIPVADVVTSLTH